MIARRFKYLCSNELRLARCFSSQSDYIVVGAGSAGCVLTNRLTEDAGTSVTLIEAGSNDKARWDWWQIAMPAALTYSVAGTRNNWDFYTKEQKHLNGRKLHEPRGKVLGGSSSINAMVYVRGNALDYDRWAEETNCQEWDYRHCLPYFKKAQRHSEGENAYRGTQGPLDVKCYNESTYTNELFKAFVDAGQDAGYDKLDDLNGYKQEGFGPLDMTISPDGERCSTAKAYLHPVLGKRDVLLLTRTQATKLLFDEKDADKVVGVECVDLETGNVSQHYANKEVILCLGAVGSPQLLMLSGIGDKAHLEQHGIAVRHHSPWVGQNLQDHLEIYLQYLCTKPVTLFPVGNWTLRYLHRRVAVGLDWFLRGMGVGASNQFESGGFIRSGAGIRYPDIQYHFIPGCVLGQLEFLPVHGFQVHVGTLRPTSRGSVTLESSDPLAAPVIDVNFLATEKDRVEMNRAVKLTEEIVQQKAFDQYRGRRLQPPPELDLRLDSTDDDARIDDWIRSSSHSAYHPSCTCAMGRVVDTEGRVLGVRAVRVVDASIMPSMTSGNLNAPTVMLAEKVADAIRGRAALPAADVDYYVSSDWETAQR